jgi:hypothetical protein
MFATILVVLVMLWLLGIATSITLGGALHALLFLAALLVIVNITRFLAGLRVL